MGTFGRKATQSYNSMTIARQPNCQRHRSSLSHGSGRRTRRSIQFP